mmetsp:Transcript_31321/g.90452  ORF Transcript_31321/g.90452 Transcript_31321/m.90452 type:complete len:206 (-) Transcript_31321:18-635(-)
MLKCETTPPALTTTRIVPVGIAAVHLSIRSPSGGAAATICRRPRHNGRFRSVRRQHATLSAPRRWGGGWLRKVAVRTSAGLGARPGLVPRSRLTGIWYSRLRGAKGLRWIMLVPVTRRTTLERGRPSGLQGRGCWGDPQRQGRGGDRQRLAGLIRPAEFEQQTPTAASECRRKGYRQPPCKDVPATTPMGAVGVRRHRLKRDAGI